MGVAEPALWFPIDASLGGWLGAMAFFSFVGAPRAFAVFGDDAFERYHRRSVILDGIAMLALALAASY